MLSVLSLYQIHWETNYTIRIPSLINVIKKRFTAFSFSSSSCFHIYWLMVCQVAVSVNGG